MFRASISRYAKVEHTNHPTTTDAERPGDLPSHLSEPRKRANTVAEPSPSTSAAGRTEPLAAQRPNETALAHAAAALLPMDFTRRRSNSEYDSPSMPIPTSALPRPKAFSAALRGSFTFGSEATSSPIFKALSSPSFGSAPVHLPMDELSLSAIAARDSGSARLSFIRERRNSVHGSPSPGLGALAPPAGSEPEPLDLPQPGVHRAIVSPSMRGLSGPRSPDDFSLASARIPETVPESEPLVGLGEIATDGPASPSAAGRRRVLTRSASLSERPAPIFESR